MSVVTTESVILNVRRRPWLLALVAVGLVAVIFGADERRVASWIARNGVALKVQP